VVVVEGGVVTTIRGDGEVVEDTVVVEGRTGAGVRGRAATGRAPGRRGWKLITWAMVSTITSSEADSTRQINTYLVVLRPLRHHCSADPNSGPPGDVPEQPKGWMTATGRLRPFLGLRRPWLGRRAYRPLVSFTGRRRALWMPLVR
jgi:hypothetical protein